MISEIVKRTEYKKHQDMVELMDNYICRSKKYSDRWDSWGPVTKKLSDGHQIWSTSLCRGISNSNENLVKYQENIGLEGGFLTTDELSKVAKTKPRAYCIFSHMNWIILTLISRPITTILNFLSNKTLYLW